MKLLSNIFSSKWVFYIFLGCIYIGMFYVTHLIADHVKSIEQNEINFKESLKVSGEDVARIQRKVVKIQNNVVKTQKNVVRIQNNVLKELKRINKQIKELQEKLDVKKNNE